MNLRKHTQNVFGLNAVSHIPSAMGHVTMYPNSFVVCSFPGSIFHEEGS